jgi:hydroxymethylglutaryl-CoA lyase
MQGLAGFIPTPVKRDYLNALLQVGFDTLDFGSFVSPKAIPQMRDTAELVEQLDLTGRTKLLAIVANQRGAESAVTFPQIDYLGYPFSISETFQMRNTNATIEESLERVEDIQALCVQNDKTLVVYISMGFGNPYGDEWNTEIVSRWTEKLSGMGIKILSLSDTIGVATPASIAYLFGHLIPAFPNIEFGAHLHTQPHNWREKVEAAHLNGCMRFDGAIKGYGGCPMAKDDLTGNMPTEQMVHYFGDALENFNHDAFYHAMELAGSVFPAAH